MKHPMMEKCRQGIKCGIPSYCTANELAMDGVTNFMLDYEYAVTL